MIEDEEKIMNTKEIIIMLEDAHYIFDLPPDPKLSNDEGLCKFFFKKYGIINENIKKILGRRYNDEKATFCRYNGRNHYQSEIYADRMYEMYSERSIWCKKKLNNILEEREIDQMNKKLKGIETSLQIMSSQLGTILTIISPSERYNRR